MNIESMLIIYYHRLSFFQKITVFFHGLPAQMKSIKT